MPLPPNEATRLQALNSYQILDTPPDEAFNDLAALASRICETPIALISLIDRDRSWHKARIGAVDIQCPRETAFCSRTICQSDVLTIRDASADPRFAANPLVTDGPMIRFYAGAPLLTAEGHAIGTLCVMDVQPRDLSSEQAASLRSLARQVVSQLELRRTQLDRNRVELQLRQAQELHRLLLNELDHRVKNNLTSLMSLIDLSARNKATVKDFAVTMKNRVRTMASAHHLLSAGRWAPVDLRRFLEELIPFECLGMVNINGPDALIPPRQLTAVGMVVQELLTNSLKYGALGAPHGRVLMEWSLAASPTDDRRRLVFTWTESGGPAIEHESPPPGMGTELIHGLVRSELRGEARFSYPREGARHALVFHLDHSGDPLASRRDSSGSGSKPPAASPTASPAVYAPAASNPIVQPATAQSVPPSGAILQRGGGPAAPQVFTRQICPPAPSSMMASHPRPAAGAPRRAC